MFGITFLSGFNLFSNITYAAPRSAGRISGMKRSPTSA